MAEISLLVKERRASFWARATPGIYLFVCALAVRSVLFDYAEVGVAGVLLAMGLVPSFVVPVVFDTRRARIAASARGVFIDGTLEKVDDVSLERASRGAAILHVTTRDGRRRTFLAPSFAEAHRLVAILPPASAPAGVLAV